MELNNEFTVTHGAPPVLEASVTDRCPASKMRQRRATHRELCIYEELLCRWEFSYE